MEEVRVENVSFAYKDKLERWILKDINLKTNAGEFVCILGQSGCGKSTLLRLLAGLEKPIDGSIWFGDKEVKGAGLDRGVVFQDYGLFPWMTAGENILLALKQKYPKEDKEKLKKIALEMLDKVGLHAEEVYKKLPKALSGGMKQRCAIARSLSVNPPVLLMDESFGALDAVTRAKLQDLLLDLREQEEVKKSIFFVTHDVDEAIYLADRVVVLGQYPSSIIYECSLPNKKRVTREEQFENHELIQFRNTLIHQINMDVAKHSDS